MPARRVGIVRAVQKAVFFVIRAADGHANDIGDGTVRPESLSFERDSLHAHHTPIAHANLPAGRRR